MTPNGDRRHMGSVEFVAGIWKLFAQEERHREKQGGEYRYSAEQGVEPFAANGVIDEPAKEVADDSGGGGYRIVHGLSGSLKIVRSKFVEIGGERPDEESVAETEQYSDGDHDLY